MSRLDVHQEGSCYSVKGIYCRSDACGVMHASLAPPFPNKLSSSPNVTQPYLILTKVQLN